MDEINAATGYANGNLFADAAEVTAYFTPAAQTAMFGQEAETDADTLDGWAAEVIRTGHHMTTTQTISLNDYANGREGVVLFCVSTAVPTGDYFPLGHSDIDFADRNGLLELSGTVDESGDWRWDGEGEPADDRGNTVTKLHAYVGEKQWAAIVEEYESAE